MFYTFGRIRYYRDYCVAYIDRGLIDYYRSLIPKTHYVQPQKYPPHITIVRQKIEASPKKENWGKYEGMEIILYYDNRICYNYDLYYWLNAKSPQIEAIRIELGLPVYRVPFNSYHITIGNKKSQTTNLGEKDEREAE